MRNFSHSLTFMISLTEENYLKAIFSLNANKKQSASTSAIAEKMETKASSVTDMLKRLKEKELIHYKKYQAVSLTENGRKIAISIIRKHRLWEYFLVEKLHFGWEEVHDLAEQLEHIRSPKLTNRLEEFLDFPEFDPHGDPIPNQEGEFPMELSETLSECGIGETVRVIGVKNHSADFLDHLNQLGIGLGTMIEVVEIVNFDQSFGIRIKEQKLRLSQEVAQNLYIKNH